MKIVEIVWDYAELKIYVGDVCVYTANVLDEDGHVAQAASDAAAAVAKALGVEVITRD